MLICEQQQVLTVRQKQILIKNLDFNGSGYISVFGFSVFTELFGDWRDILYKWKVLCLYHSGYIGLMTKIEVHFYLLNHIDKPGVYVFTCCLENLGKWVITYIGNNKKIISTKLYNRNIVHALLQGYNSH